MKNFLREYFFEAFLAVAVIVVYSAMLLAAPYFHTRQDPPALIGAFAFLFAPIMAALVPFAYIKYRAEKDAAKQLAKFASKLTLAAGFAAFAFGGYKSAANLIQSPLHFWNCVGGFVAVSVMMFSVTGVVVIAASKPSDDEPESSD